MCGILALLGTNPEQPLAPDDRAWARGVAAARARLRARGPDDEGAWTNPERTLRLFHTRLAINDLSPAGAQPMVASDPATGRPVALACNGEIYNAPALRARLEREGVRFASRSDSEVVLHALVRWGIERTLAELTGMYAFVAWNGRTGEVHLAVDPTSMKPLFFTRTNDAYVIASDADALLSACPGGRPIDPLAIRDLLCLGYVPHPRTMYDGVEKLPPGTSLTLRPGHDPVRRTHWRPPADIEHAPPDPRADLARFEPLLRDVVREHLLSDRPIGLFLSAGLDSATVACALAEANADVTAFTLALDSDDDEAPDAARLCERLGLRHERVPFGTLDLVRTLDLAGEVYDEPQAFGALLTQLAIARATRDNAPVMLTGDGGDEAFGGYAWHVPPPAQPGAEPELATPALVGAGVVRSAGHALAERVGSPDATPGERWRALHALHRESFVASHCQRTVQRFHPSEADAILAPVLRDAPGASPFERIAPHDAPDLPSIRRAQRLDLMTFCAASINPKVDRAAMSVAMETRAPLLDRRLLEFGLTRPVRPEESDARTLKPILRDFLRTRVPSGILSRPKQGFSLNVDPGPTWVALLPRLRASALARSGLLCPQWEAFVGEDAPHRAGRLFALHMLSAWYERRFA